MIRRICLCLSAGILAGGCTFPVETFRAAAYSEIARVQMASGDPAGARDTAARAVAAIADADTADERVFGIPAAAIAQLRAGDIDGAESIIERIDKDDGLAFGYVALAIALMDSGHPTRARQAASRALETAAGSEDENSRDEMTVYAAWAQAVTGDPAGARRRAAGVSGREERDGLLALIAEAQLEAGDTAGARATADTIGDDAARTDNEAWLFGRIVRGLAIDPIAAFDDVVFHGEVPMKSILLTRIAVAQARTGNRDGARQSFAAALDVVGEIDAFSDRLRAVRSIALNRARIGDVAGAIEMLDDAEREVAELATGPVGPGAEALIYLQVARSAIRGQPVVAELAAHPSEADDEDLVLAAMVHVQLGNARQAEGDLAVAAMHISGNELSLLTAAYASLAELQRARGNRAGAGAAARHALANADRFPEPSDDQAVGQFFAAVALARSGDITRALETAARMRKPSGR